MATLSSMRSDFSSQLRGYIESVVAREVDQIIKKHKEQMVTEIDAVRQDVIARSAIKIARYTDVHMSNDRLVITMENPAHTEVKSKENK